MRKHTKAIIAILMTLVFLTACGAGSSGSTASGGAKEEAAATEAGGETAEAEGEAAETQSGGTYDICYISTVEDEWLTQLLNEMTAAGEKNGVNLDVKHAGNDSSKVLECIEQAKSEKKQAVIINVAYSNDIPACIETAGDMKVVFVNRVPDAADYSLLNENVTAVCSDENLAGTYQGEYLAEYFTGKGQTDVKYLILQGSLNLVHSVIRSEVPVKVMKEAGLNPVEVSAVAADYNREAAKEGVKALLEDESLEFDCIISNNDAMALGAIAALEEAGRNPADTPIVGIDATADGVQAILDGTLSMSVFQSAAGQANAAVLMAKNMIDGNPAGDGTGCEASPDCEYLLYVPFEKVTPENAADYMK